MPFSKKNNCSMKMMSSFSLISFILCSTGCVGLSPAVLSKEEEIGEVLLSIYITHACGRKEKLQPSEIKQLLEFNSNISSTNSCGNKTDNNKNQVRKLIMNEYSNQYNKIIQFSSKYMSLPNKINPFKHFDQIYFGSKHKLSRSQRKKFKCLFNRCYFIKPKKDVTSDHSKEILNGNIINNDNILVNFCLTQLDVNSKFIVITIGEDNFICGRKEYIVNEIIKIENEMQK